MSRRKRNRNRDREGAAGDGKRKQAKAGRFAPAAAPDRGDDPAPTRLWGANLRRAFLAVVLFAAAGGIGAGLHTLEGEVHAKPQFHQPPRITLLDVPDGIREIIESQLASLGDRDWIEPDLCRRIAHRLEHIAWVRQVERVRRMPTGQIEVRCLYRRPAALVQDGVEFVLIDSDRVRLPGRYPYTSAWLLIQGVAGPAPEAGEVWDALDLAAGVTILEHIAAEPFADQVTAVQVHNYGGRVDFRSPHIELATERAGGRILWGSAPGEEFEENTVDQKLAILRRNQEVYGRIDAGRRVIDISTFPDRFTTPDDGESALAGAADGG